MAGSMPSFKDRETWGSRHRKKLSQQHLVTLFCLNSGLPLSGHSLSGHPGSADPSSILIPERRDWDMVRSGPATKEQARRAMSCCPATASMQTMSQEGASDVTEGLLVVCKISFSSLVSSSGSDIVQKYSNFSS